MTAPTPGAGPLGEDATRDAVLAGLAAEHAAIWSYGLATAFLGDADTTASTEPAAAHRDRRDAVLALLEAGGVEPVPAAAAYRTPVPVTDAASAAALLAVAEEDVAAAWRAVCERTEARDGATLRELAVDAVVAAARSGVRWRRLAGTEPVVPLLPGAPGP